MRFKTRRLLVRIHRYPLWFSLLALPLLQPFLSCPRLLLTAAVVVASVLSVLKCRGLLPLYHWQGIALVSTSFFWYPILMGYMVFLPLGMVHLWQRLRAWRRGPTA